MTRGRRILQFTIGSSDDDAISSDLLGLYVGFRERSRQLEALAEQAPHDSAERELRRLAAAEVALAGRLEVALSEQGASAPPLAPTPAAAEETNHWARLVAALEAHREARAQLLDAATSIPDQAPELIPLLDDLSRGVDSLLSGLRTLIARADPQALD